MATEPATAGGGHDPLEGAEWWCAASPPGDRSGPGDLAGAGLHWLAAAVPGTVAGALHAAGASEPPPERLDGGDWWFRCRFPAPSGPTVAPAGWILELEGLATLADVWLNGDHLLRSESMFASWRVPVAALADDDNELCLRFAALTPVLGERRPRPRWKAKGIGNQNLRWIRTTLLGRQAGWAEIPVPVGPWRPLRLRPTAPVELVSRQVRAGCPPGADGRTTGTVTVELVVGGPAVAGDVAPGAELVVHGRTVPLDAVPDGPRWRLSGSVRVDGIRRWWPHTHGDQPLYAVRAVVAGVGLDLGDVGFRTVTAERADGGFHFIVNGTPVFCRGAGWYPIDPVTLQATDREVADSVDLARRAGCNMLRVPGGTVYEDERFFVACDRAGILVWQDAMLALLDPPDDDGFLATIADEVSGLLDRAGAHPSLALLCGGQQLEEQPAMHGLPRDRWRSTVTDAVLPDLVARQAPGLAYVSSSPSGGDLPFQSDEGVSHYVGVGVCLFPLDDLRRAAPRFVSEGFAFSIPPERVTVDEEFAGDPTAHHGSAWKRAVHRDAGSWFDLEDVRDHYTRTLFGVDVDGLRRTDPERALELGRATMVEVMAAAVAEWRRPGSPCNGMLTIALRDLRPGPGWGLVDSSGRPKAPWYAMARGSTAVAVLATDEGVNGLALHLVNDTAAAVPVTLMLRLHTADHEVESASCPVEVPARGGTSLRADSLVDGFRDLTYAFRFGPRAYELVTAELVGADGGVLARAGYLPGGPARATDPDVGLQAGLVEADEGEWLLCVSSRRFAQYVQVDVPGFVPDDSWFHLPPGGSRDVRLRPEHGSGHEPKGRVRALNSATQAVVSP